MSRVLLVVENLSVPFDRRPWQEALALREAGFDVAVISPQGLGRDTAAREVLDGIEIHRFPQRASVGSPTGFVREYSSALWHITRIARRLAVTRPFDVVHLANPPDVLFLAVLPPKLRGARLIFDQHDLVPELFLSRSGRRGLVYGLLRAAEYATYAFSDVVLATNESYRRVALTRGRRSPDRVFVVRNAPDLERLSPGAPDPALKRRRQHLIAYLGLMGVQDGVDSALRALARLRALREDWHAVFMGDGEVLDAMRALARELGLDEAVDFMGRADDREIVHVLSTADVCLAPEPSNPHNDVSSMVKLVEYMAMERPIVAFDLPETRASAGDAALYARQGDEDEFADLIATLLSRPDLRSRLGTSGRRRIEGDLSWDRSKRALLAAYARALA